MIKTQRNNPSFSNIVIQINIVFFTFLKRYSLPLVFIFLFSHCSTSRMIPQQSDYDSNLSKIRTVSEEHIFVRKF
jgi:hypothetical protein